MPYVRKSVYEELLRYYRIYHVLVSEFQRNVFKIICNTCNEDVTATIGCKTCHPESFSNSQNMKETQY